MAGKSGRSINNVPEAPLKRMLLSWEGILVVLFVLVNIFCASFSEFYNLKNLLRQMPVYLAEVFLLLPMAYTHLNFCLGPRACRNSASMGPDDSDKPVLTDKRTFQPKIRVMG